MDSTIVVFWLAIASVLWIGHEIGQRRQFPKLNRLRDEAERLRKQLQPRNGPIRLEDAYAWTCPRCHVRNYVDCETVTLDREQQREIAVEMGDLEAWQELPPGHVITARTHPAFVTCQDCGYHEETITPPVDDGWEE